MQIQSNKYVQSLSQKGYVVIEDYLSARECDEIYTQAMNVIEQIEYDENNIPESGLQMWYDEMDVRIRGGRDYGMFDIYHIDAAIDRLREFKHDQEIIDIINDTAGRDFVPISTNLYYKNSQLTTRGPHHDTMVEKYKAFVYLTDVKNDSDGPYCYIPGTHNPSIDQRFRTFAKNKLAGKKRTDNVLFDPEKAEKLHAPKGTLIISNQSGVHFGQPQSKGHERMLATTHIELA
jgi:hypothetical protein